MIPNILKSGIRLIRPLYYYHVGHRADRETEIFLGYLRKSDCVLEIGAFCGNASRIYSQSCNFVHAVEANPECFRYLRKLKEKNLKTYNFAAFDAKSDLGLHISSSYRMSGEDSLAAIDGAKPKRSVIVEARRIDQVSWNPFPDVAFFDIEGSEIQALKGASGILGKLRVIGLESHFVEGKGTMENVIDLLSHYSFEQVYISQVSSPLHSIESIAVFENRSIFEEMKEK